MANSRNHRSAHPYVQWEHTTLWKTIEKGIVDLVDNDDIVEKTDRNYIVGYLCRAVSRRKQGIIAQLKSEGHS